MLSSFFKCCLLFVSLDIGNVFQMDAVIKFREHIFSGASQLFISKNNLIKQLLIINLY